MEVRERSGCESFDEDVNHDVRVVEGGIELVSGRTKMCKVRAQRDYECSENYGQL